MTASPLHWAYEGRSMGRRGFRSRKEQSGQDGKLLLEKPRIRQITLRHGQAKVGRPTLQFGELLYQQVQVKRVGRLAKLRHTHVSHQFHVF